MAYLITSDRNADPATLAAWISGHWHMEDKLHGVRDVAYQEDNRWSRRERAPARSPLQLTIMGR